MGASDRRSGGESSSFLGGDSDPVPLSLGFSTSGSLMRRVVVTNFLHLKLFNHDFNLRNGCKDTY